MKHSTPASPARPIPRHLSFALHTEAEPKLMLAHTHTLLKTCLRRQTEKHAAATNAIENSGVPLFRGSAQIRSDSSSYQVSNFARRHTALGEHRKQCVLRQLIKSPGIELLIKLVLGGEITRSEGHISSSISD
jgi:hypothetical protein